MTSFNISSTLEKMNSRDKDFRYMATVDLVAELQKGNFKLDIDSEKKITSKILDLLQDNSNQVQELAVKCLGPLCKKIKEQNLQEIIDNLCKHLLNSKKGSEELRDIASIGLKTIIHEISPDPSPITSLVCNKLTPQLITGISNTKEENADIVSYCLEIMNDLLGKFGSQMVADHEKILKVIQPQLMSKRNISRKRAINCLAHLAITIPDNLFIDLIKNLIHLIDPSTKQEYLKTYISAIAAISRSVGYRLGKYLSEICPIIINYCEYKNDDELRENCFQCFESLIHRCPKDITPFLPKIIGLCIQFIKYDPNYSVDEETENMETEEIEEEEEDEDEYQGEDYSDDEDMSWKVRRASTKCLSVIITTRPEMLLEIYQKIAPILISCFKEREENVKLDIFSTFVDLLKQTSFMARRNPELIDLTKSPLIPLISKIVNILTKLLKGKSLKIRSGAFSLLKELVLTIKGCLTDYVANIIPGIQLSLGNKNTNSNLKIESLIFLRLLLASHSPAIFHPHIKILVTCVFKAVRDSYYRISAEALRVSCELVYVLIDSSFDYKSYVQELFQATLEKLKMQDIDQEVKESAINCMGLIIANLGHYCQNDIPQVLKIFLDRLNNEITRLTTVKALENIGNSKLHIDLNPILQPTIKELSTFLRKANRQLKQSSLSTLIVLIKNYGNSNISNLLTPILVELGHLISDSDLHITYLSLNLCISILQIHPPAITSISTDIFPKATELLKSSLLQGIALESLLNLFSELVKINSPQLNFNILLNSLLSLVNQKEVSRSVLYNVAKGISSLCLAADVSDLHKTISKFINDLQNEQSRHLALYCIGEIGRNIDLSNHTNLQKSVLLAFDSTNEEIRQAASFALGNIAIGSFEKYLPQILDEIKKNSKSKYLLLHSLREIIVRQSINSKGIETLRLHQKEILPILFSGCENEEEGTRNVVAECLGKLCLVSPNDLLPTLLEKLNVDNPFILSTIVTALKFAIVEKPQPVDELIQPQMSKFFDLLKNKDINVRRNTLLTINYIAHNKPSLLRDILPSYISFIYSDAKVKPELIREVDLGPFKHKVDDGLEIRKAAFECMYTLLEACIDRLNISTFISYLVEGLKDHYDIKMLANLMLIRLATFAGPTLVESLEYLIEPLRTTLTSKPKESSVKQEIERNDELIRSTLRAIIAITKIPNVETNLKFEQFLKETVKIGDIGDKYRLLKVENEQHNDTIDKMDLS